MEEYGTDPQYGVDPTVPAYTQTLEPLDFDTEDRKEISTDLPALDLAKIDKSAWDQLLANGLIRSEDIIDAQRALDQEADDQEWDGPPKTDKTLKDLAMTFGVPDSLGTFFEEMQDAFVGTMGDLLGASENKKSVGEALTGNNRLRGFGGILVLIALIGLIVSSFVDE